MFLVLKLFYNALTSHFKSVGSDPRTCNLPLISSYAQTIAVILAYFMVVFKILPRFMAKRNPYNIKSIIQIYNIFQILMNAYIFVGIAKNYGFHPQYNWFCMRYDKTDWSPETVALRQFTYLYFVNKILDFFDTIFFILRKKYNQVTFLHVYHHGIMVFGGFMYHNIGFGSHFTIVAFINSFIHILMYAYYFVAALDTKINLNGWKPRLTEIQIIQFFYITIKIGFALYNNWCGLPTFWLSLLFIQTLFMTSMFSHFYWKTYIVKGSKIKKQANKECLKEKL